MFDGRFGLRDEAHRGISAVAAISGDFGMRCRGGDGGAAGGGRELIYLAVM